MAMTWLGKSVFLVPAILALAAVARGSITATNTNPYEVIAERNAFALKPPPPPPPPPTNKPPEVHNVKFTGITHDLTGKKVYLLADSPVKPGQQPVREYYCLAEGERQGDIEVKEINEAAETVTILNGGELATLNFKEHGNAASPPPMQPGRPGVPLPGVPPPPGMAMAPNVAAYNPATGMPFNNPGVAAAQTPVASLSEAVNYGSSPNNSTRSIPTRSMRMQPTPLQPIPAVPPPPQIDPDVQKTLMLINSQGGGPPLPPIE